MTRAKSFSLALAALGLVVVIVIGWTRSPVSAAGPQSMGGDPALADVAIILPGDIRASGKYSFFILERENSSNRWFMRFDSEAGTLAKLTADKGWVPVASTQDLHR
jgi:hypothetical protein